MKLFYKKDNKCIKMIKTDELKQNDDLFNAIFNIVDYSIKHRRAGGIVNEKVRELIKNERLGGCVDGKTIALRVVSDLYASVLLKSKGGFIMDNKDINNKVAYVYTVLKNILLDEVKIEKRHKEIQNGIFDKGMSSIRYDVNPMYYNLEELSKEALDPYKEIKAEEFINAVGKAIGYSVVMYILSGCDLSAALSKVYNIDIKNKHKLKPIIKDIRTKAKALIDELNIGLSKDTVNSLNL